MSNTKPARVRRPSATPPNLTTGDLLTVAQAADYLNITEHFVRRLIQEHRLPFIRVGRLIRLRRSALEAWLIESEVPASPPMTQARRAWRIS